MGISAQVATYIPSGNWNKEMCSFISIPPQSHCNTPNVPHKMVITLLRQARCPLPQRRTTPRFLEYHGRDQARCRSVLRLKCPVQSPRSDAPQGGWNRHWLVESETAGQADDANGAHRFAVPDTRSVFALFPLKRFQDA